MSLDLGAGLVIQIDQPGPPVVRVDLPATADHLVVPIAGPPGPAAGVTAYTHTQVVAQAVWTVTHGLGRYPTAWSLHDTAGRLCDNYDVSHVDLNGSLVSMDVPTAGVLRLI